MPWFFHTSLRNRSFSHGVHSAAQKQTGFVFRKQSSSFYNSWREHSYLIVPHGFHHVGGNVSQRFVKDSFPATTHLCWMLFPFMGSARVHCYFTKCQARKEINRLVQVRHTTNCKLFLNFFMVRCSIPFRKSAVGPATSLCFSHLVYISEWHKETFNSHLI